MSSTATVIAEAAGERYLISLDKGHRLEIRRNGVEPSVIESRPVTEFAAAVDAGGKLHIAAWLLSRHLMYYTSGDGEMFTRSTLLKSDFGLRLKDCLVHCGLCVSVAYVAETEQSDTLVCYRYDGGEWNGRRIVETDHPQRLAAYQFDGPADGPSILYSVREQSRTVVMTRAASGDAPSETIATVSGGLTDFCAITAGGVRQACWVADGHLYINGMRQTEDPWTRTWPCLVRDDGGIRCIWLEDGMLKGAAMGTQRAWLRPQKVPDVLPCMLALPGESHRSIVDGNTLQEVRLQPELPERPQAGAPQQPLARPEGRQGAQAELTLTDVVRNQAVYLTRMQESLGGLERNMLRLQAEVNRLSREMAVLMREKQDQPDR